MVFSGRNLHEARAIRVPGSFPGIPTPPYRAPEALQNLFNIIPAYRYQYMLTRKVTPEMIREWKETFQQYRPRLRPNARNGHEILAYLTGHYPVREIPAESISEIISDNVLLNDGNARKLPPGTTPEAAGFFIENSGAGKTLYENQDEFFRGTPIIAGVEIHSAYFLVEGSSLLWDELFAFRGLDEMDLANYYLVAEYVACLRRFDRLERVLAGGE